MEGHCLHYLDLTSQALLQFMAKFVIVHVAYKQADVSQIRHTGQLCPSTLLVGHRW